MTLSLDKFLGRNVRLTPKAFNEVSRRAVDDDGVLSENLFVVAQVDRGLHKLVCYGKNHRVVVATADVILV